MVNVIVPTRVGCYALIESDAGVLLVHWHEVVEGLVYEAWTLPGGGAEWGEQAWQTVLREVHEETGLDIVLGGIVGVDSWYRAEGEHPLAPIVFQRIVFRAHTAGGRLRVEENGTTDDVRWFTRAEIAALDRVSLVDLALAQADALDGTASRPSQE